MRTTVNIPDELYTDILKLTNASTTASAVNEALADWARRKKVERVKALVGKIHFDEPLERLDFRKHPGKRG